MEPLKVVIDIPFNLNLSEYMLPKNYIHIKLKKSFGMAQTRTWIERRMEIFMKYTCNSLRRQTNQNFLCLLRCTRETEGIIQDVLRKYPSLPRNIIFTSKAQQMIDEMMKNTLKLYHVVIDSDNMYEANFIEKLFCFKSKPETQTLLCQEGYVYDERSQRLITIFHKSPSFYAAIYNKETYRTLFKQRLFEKHWHAINYPYEVLPGRNYCICIHDQNVDNDFEKIKIGYKGQDVEGIEKEMFLRNWGIRGM